MKTPTAKQSLGKWGEALAENTLIAKGYEFMERNFRFKKHEIDLLFKQQIKEGPNIGKELWVVVEVKTRKNNSLGYPEEFVSETQKASIHAALNHYLEKNGLGLPLIRFDIVAITIHPSGVPEIKHFEDAF